MATREGYLCNRDGTFQQGLQCSATIRPSANIPDPNFDMFDVVVLGAGYAGLTVRVHGAPFLSEENDIYMVSFGRHFRQMFDCLKYCAQQQPHSSDNVPRNMDLLQQAHKIYLHQAQSHVLVIQEESVSESIELVQQYKETLEAFPPGSTGEAVLTWPTFIAASDCILTEHTSFFEDVFLRYYARGSFGNVLAGLDCLRHMGFDVTCCYNNVSLGFKYSMTQHIR